MMINKVALIRGVWPGGYGWYPPVFEACFYGKDAM